MNDYDNKSFVRKEGNVWQVVSMCDIKRGDIFKHPGNAEVVGPRKVYEAVTDAQQNSSGTWGVVMRVSTRT